MQVSSSTSSSKVVQETVTSGGLWILIRNGLLLLVTIVVMDQLVGAVLHYMYFRQKAGPGHETTYVFTEMHHEAFILGSSRGRRNYNPKIIEDSLQLSCFNAGHDGQTIFYEQAIVRMALSRYTPKLVIIDLNPEEMYYRPLHYDRLNVLAPYYGDYPQIRDIYLLKGIRNRDDKGNEFFVNPSESALKNFWREHGSAEEIFLPFNSEKIKLASGIYRYNSSILDILSGMFRKSRKSESGFKPLNGVISEKKAEELIRQNAELRNEKGKKVDQHKLEGFEEILSTLTSRGTKVYVCMSPALAPFGREPSYDAIEKACAKYGVPFRDYSKDKTYDSFDYFFDNHMNKVGSTLFTSNLASDIKRLYFSDITKRVTASGPDGYSHENTADQR